VALCAVDHVRASDLTGNPSLVANSFFLGE